MRQAFSALLGVSLVVWVVMPILNHAPTVFETIQNHPEMIAEHGHSHGFEEDILWAMHGYSHDAADLDHSEAHVALGARTRRASTYRDARRARGSPDCQSARNLDPRSASSIGPDAVLVKYFTLQTWAWA